MSKNNNTKMSDDIIEFVLPHLQDPADKASISLVCHRWYELDRLIRGHITVALLYATTGEQLYNRFPYIESLKLKGKPRADAYALLPENWGGYLQPWTPSLVRFPKLKKLHLLRTIVTDTDLETLISAKGEFLVSLKLDQCSGFSTDGLLIIARTCRNLVTLVLEGSYILNPNGEWLRDLALNNNRVLETLCFYATSIEDINVTYLELLAKNCPLKSVKIGDTDLIRLVNFFRTTPSLQEFCGGLFSNDENYTNFSFPVLIQSLSIMYMERVHLPMVVPVSHSLLQLDLLYASLDSEGHCELLSRCRNLEILKTTTVIGDQGLEVLALSCTRLKKLRIEHEGVNEENVEGPGLSQRGLKAIAEGCRKLEYLAIFMTNVTNEALERVGENLSNLNDFRLVLVDGEMCEDLPLDNGIRAVLQGCRNITRFAVKLRHGGLTDTGLGYIGQFGENIKSMLLGKVGETDAGLLQLSNGCPKLQKLEIRPCIFTEQALAIAATRFVSLKSLWVQGYLSSNRGTEDFLRMARPYWNIEHVPGEAYEIDGITEGQPVMSTIYAYYSLAGQRTDHPSTVVPLLLPQI
ncbi:coronatine-insensitive protein 1-like [Silene latifolia]|uniref:coronatine-insensitive protein 1-like n=1 Tax=Silene latifolia TaxID=37657 RepID=UPI003D789016